MKGWNRKDFDIFNDLEVRKNHTHDCVGGDKSGKIKDGDLILMAAFGSGFTWGASLMRW